MVLFVCVRLPLVIKDTNIDQHALKNDASVLLQNVHFTSRLQCVAYIVTILWVRRQEITDSYMITCRNSFISSELIANMQGDKAALLAEVQARMIADPEMARGIGLDPIDPTDPGLNQPVMAPMACPFSSGQAMTPKGRQAANGLCPMGYWSHQPCVQKYEA